MLVKEQPIFRILYHPLQPLMKIPPCHRTAWKNSPLMRFDQIQPKTLRRSSARSVCQKGPRIPRDTRRSTYLSNLLLGHTMFHISLVEKDQKTRPHQPLVVVVVVVSRDGQSARNGWGTNLFQEQASQLLATIIDS